MYAPDFHLDSQWRYHASLIRVLAVIALAAVAVAAVLFIVAPSTFFLSLPTAVAMLLIFVTSFLLVVRSPPEWFAAAFIVVAFSMMDLNLRPTAPVDAGFDIQSIAKGVIWLGVLLFGLIHGRGGLLRNPLTFFLTSYALLAVASAAYAPSLTLAIGGGVALLAVATNAGVVGKMDIVNLLRVWRYLYSAIVVLCFSSLLLYFVLPDWARDMRAGGFGRLRGVTGSANSLGPIAAIGVIVAAFELQRARTYGQRANRLFVLCALGVTLLLTQSRGAIIGALAAFAIEAALRHAILFIFIVVCGVLLVWLLLQPEYFQTILAALASEISRSGNTKELISMTDRTEIWSAIVPKWLESPWFGFGLGGPRSVIPEAYRNVWGQTQESAHNWVLESLLSVGLVGTLVLSIFLALLTFKAWQLRMDPIINSESCHAALMSCVLRCILFILVSGVVEKGFAGMPNPGTALLAILAGTVLVVDRTTHSRELVPGSL